MTNPNVPTEKLEELLKLANGMGMPGNLFNNYRLEMNLLDLKPFVEELLARRALDQGVKETVGWYAETHSEYGRTIEHDLVTGEPLREVIEVGNHDDGKRARALIATAEWKALFDE